MPAQTDACPGIFGHRSRFVATFTRASLPPCCSTAVDCFPIGQVSVCAGMLRHRIFDPASTLDRLMYGRVEGILPSQTQSGWVLQRIWLGRRPQSTLDRMRYGRVEGIPPRMLGGEWTDSDIRTKGNPGFVYALACPYNVMGNFGWPEIGHAGW
jgi:hypothetical protein